MPFDSFVKLSFFYFFLEKTNLMAPFYAWGSTALF